MKTQPTVYKPSVLTRKRTLLGVMIFLSLLQNLLLISASVDSRYYVYKPICSLFLYLVLRITAIFSIAVQRYFSYPDLWFRGSCG